jgi:hypothetical protein
MRKTVVFGRPGAERDLDWVRIGAFGQAPLLLTSPWRPLLVRWSLPE